MLSLSVAVSASSHVQNTYTCSTPGRIYRVGCWLDYKGYVTGIAFEDDYGVKSPAMCQARGEPQILETLMPDESIVDVVACKYVCMTQQQLEPAQLLVELQLQ